MRLVSRTGRLNYIRIEDLSGRGEGKETKEAREDNARLTSEDGIGDWKLNSLKQFGITKQEKDHQGGQQGGERSWESGLM